MNELLYQKNQAVASLNRVEGFEPLEFARTIKQEDQADQLYLDVKYRKLWFRLSIRREGFPAASYSLTRIWRWQRRRSIWITKMQPENYVANAFSMKFRTEDPKFGDKFLEMAETAAVGRALSDAGFGVQFADVGESDDPNQVDAGIPVPLQYPDTETGIPAYGEQPSLSGQAACNRQDIYSGNTPQETGHIRTDRQKLIPARI